jgi:hypothetical protein
MAILEIQIVDKSRTHSKCPRCHLFYTQGELRVLAAGYYIYKHAHLSCLINRTSLQLSALQGMAERKK